MKETANISSMQKRFMPDGAGLLHERFEALKKELEEMGMFAPEYKQPIPKYVHTVGNRDGIYRERQYGISFTLLPGEIRMYSLLLYPAQVQGRGGGGKYCTAESGCWKNKRWML